MARVKEYRIVLSAPGRAGELVVGATSIGHRHAIDECDRIAQRTPAGHILRVVTDRGVELYTRQGGDSKT